MRQQKIIFLLLVVAVTLIIALSTGVGYAVSTGNTLKVHDNIHIRPEQANFDVRFTGEPTYVGNGEAKINITGNTTATIDITGLSVAGDYVITTFKIKNTSYDIDAKLSKSVTNTNSEYFKVTATLSSDTIAQRNGEETLNIRVELIKTPISKSEKTNICVMVIANPS